MTVRPDREILAEAWGGSAQWGVVRQRILDGSCCFHSDPVSLACALALEAMSAPRTLVAVLVFLDDGFNAAKLVETRGVFGTTAQARAYVEGVGWGEMTLEGGQDEEYPSWSLLGPGGVASDFTVVTTTVDYQPEFTHS